MKTLPSRLVVSLFAAFVALPAVAQTVATVNGTTIPQARADVIVLSDRIEDLPVVFATARRTLAVVRQNLRWALIYNAVSVPLALVGWMPPWLAGVGMAASSLLVVVNALRLTTWRPRLPGKV